jgi:protein phosphatase
MLLKAVGVEPYVIPDYFRIQIPENFRLLLCSDGLSGFCSSEEIENVLKNNSFENLSDEFIRLAISKGGRDNITVAVIAE